MVINGEKQLHKTLSEALRSLILYWPKGQQKKHKIPMVKVIVKIKVHNANNALHHVHLDRILI